MSKSCSMPSSSLPGCMKTPSCSNITCVTEVVSSGSVTSCHIGPPTLYHMIILSTYQNMTDDLVIMLVHNSTGHIQNFINRSKLYLVRLEPDQKAGCFVEAQL